MTMIEIPDEQAAALKARAAEQGLTLEAWLEKLARDPSPGRLAAAPRRHISEVIRERMRKVPSEIMGSMPEDGASQHDHYIYGVPKSPR